MLLRVDPVLPLRLSHWIVPLEDGQKVLVLPWHHQILKNLLLLPRGLYLKRRLLPVLSVLAVMLPLLPLMLH
jgi:hypothetical protein